MHISVIGTGYVGLVTGACFAEFGVNVTCMDTDTKRITRLAHGEVPFYEPGITELVTKGIKENRLTFTTDVAQAVDTALAIFIAVGTPPRPDGSADLSYIEKVGRDIANIMTTYKVIVTKSTVPVGTGEKLREVVTATQSTPCQFDIVSNPEFLREGSAIEDFMHPNRIVIGADSERAIAIMKELYRPLYLIETPFLVTDIPTAEMIKYASNAFLATKISFINEIATVCEQMGANVQEVAKGMGLDNRIGAKFLHAGAGFGGSCFPKDLAALIQTGKQVGVALQLANAAARVNEQQRDRMVEKITKVMGPLTGKTFAMLGLSFKPNTNDLRDAPALAIAEKLMRQGATVRAYDPAGLEEACQLLSGLIPSKDIYETAIGADAMILMTEWNQFRTLDFKKLKTLVRQPIFFDFRNVYDPEKIAAAGFHCISVGRPNKAPTSTT